MSDDKLEGCKQWVSTHGVLGAFGSEIDSAIIVKIYGLDPEKERSYSPAKCIGAERIPITGNPGFTRLANSFSKKVENLAGAVALHFMYYNFGRIHGTLRVTPAMEAHISDHVWSLEEIAELTDH